MIDWINANTELPENNQYVLAHTPFCKYKHAVAFFNGVEWRSADNQCEVWNIEFWMKLPELPC